MTTTAPTTTAASTTPRSAAPRLKSRRAHSVDKPRRNVLLTVLTAIVLLYALVPLAWLVISSSKMSRPGFDGGFQSQGG